MEENVNYQYKIDAHWQWNWVTCTLVIKIGEGRLSVQAVMYLSWLAWENIEFHLHQSLCTQRQPSRDELNFVIHMDTYHWQRRPWFLFGQICCFYANVEKAKKKNLLYDMAYNLHLSHLRKNWVTPISSTCLPFYGKVVACGSLLILCIARYLTQLQTILIKQLQYSETGNMFWKSITMHSRMHDTITRIISFPSSSFPWKFHHALA